MTAGCISVVLLVEDAAPSPAAVHALVGVLAAVAEDVELTVMANGCPPEVAAGVQALVEATPDARGVFLPHRLGPRAAWLLGLESALGDLVVLSRGRPEEAALAPMFLAPALRGEDMVVARLIPAAPPTAARRLFDLAFSAFAACSRLAADVRLRSDLSEFRILSRRAAQAALQHPSGELLLRAEALPEGLSTRVLRLSSGRVGWPREAPGSPQRALRALLAGSDLLVRAAVWLALGVALGVTALGGLEALKAAEVGPANGVAAMLLGFALMSALLAAVLVVITEWLLELRRTGLVRRRRSPPTREVRSTLSRSDGRLNVVDGEGLLRRPTP